MEAMSNKVANIVGSILLYLAIFGTLKIIGIITLPWIWLLVPIWGSFILFFIAMLISIWIIANKGKGDWNE